MNFHNYKKASDYRVQEWLEKSIRELTAYQKEKIRDDEIVRLSPFEFYERRETVKNIFIRLSIIVMPLVWILIFISLPFNFIITGNWGYSYDKIEWFDAWKNAVGL
jgi:hypothetical protein